MRFGGSLLTSRWARKNTLDGLSKWGHPQRIVMCWSACVRVIAIQMQVPSNRNSSQPVSLSNSLLGCLTSFPRRSQGIRPRKWKRVQRQGNESEKQELHTRPEGRGQDSLKTCFDIEISGMPSISGGLSRRASDWHRNRKVRIISVRRPTC